MRIERASFGTLVVDGRTFHSDLLIFPDGRVEDGWRRRRGHRLDFDDLEGLIRASPEVLVAGTGVFGLMKPEADLEDRLRGAGIRLLCARNKDAAEIFNGLPAGSRAGACFHLTC